MKGGAKAAALVAAAAGAYAIWRKAGRGLPPSPPDLRLDGYAEAGSDRGRGNLLGVQPYMLPDDYASEERFRAKLNGYLDAARQRGWLSEKTIVVLPEDLGLWLVAVDEKRSVYREPSVAGAAKTLALSNLLPFARHMVFSPARDRVKYSLFRMKAARLSAIYGRVLSGLARTYRVTVVGGSFLLPSPRVHRGRLHAGRGRLYNVCPVYRPDGRPHEKLTLKAYPVPDESPFVAAATADPPVYHTPAGRLGVLICVDAWFAEPYDALRRQEAQIVAVPSYAFPNDHWFKPWGGYVHLERPADVAETDVGALAAGQAWVRYALPGRIGASGARYGMNVFLRGRLWDMGSDGHTIAVADGEVIEARHVDGASLTNVWL